MASDCDFRPAPVLITQLMIFPAERFEILVDFSDGKAVALETGPDKEMGEFGRVACGLCGYHAVQTDRKHHEFETTAEAPR